MNTFTSRWWRPRDAGFQFAEQTSPLIARTGNTGVCFSGGRTRAPCAAVGQLRGLASLGLLEGVRYISSVSGGSWGSTPFLWGSPEHSDDALLGALTEPEDITLKGLEEPLPADAIAAAATTNLGEEMLRQHRNGVATDRLWLESVGTVYLQPFGLHDTSAPAYIASSDAEVDQIRQRNPALGDASFVMPRAPDRLPFHVINACGIGPAALEPFEKESPLSFEVTARYGGNPQLRQQLFFSKDGRWQEARLGGGYLETFSLGSPGLHSVLGDGTEVEVEAPQRPYTLADAVGTSSAAFAGVIAESGILEDVANLTPQLTVWPLEEGGSSEVFAMGDGGVLENYGLLSLLRRKVGRVVVFINTATPIDLEYVPDEKVPTADEIDAFLPPLFGFKISSLGVAMQNNTVFNGDDWAPLIQGLQAARKAGRSVVHRMTHQVRENTFWGIEGGWSVEILWCYLSRIPQWEGRLPGPVSDAIDRGHHRIFKGDYAHFPHYKTDGQNTIGDVHLTDGQARLLSDLTCWSVQAEQVQVKALLAVS